MHESYLFKTNIKRSQEKNQDNSENKRDKKPAKREKQITQKGSVIRTKS